MKKLFFAICFSIYSISAQAEVRGVLDYNQAQTQAHSLSLEEQNSIMRERQKFYQMPAEEMRNYLQERLKNVVVTKFDNEDGLGGSGAMSIEKSPEAKEIEKQANKSFFERVYDNAMNSVINLSKPRPKAPLYSENKKILPSAAEKALYQQIQSMQNQQTSGPVIETTLPPNNTKVLIPAMEHIPYYFSQIEILPDSLGKFTDTIVVVANNEKIKNGLIRAFPKYIINREGERQKLSYNIIDVKINEKSIPYKIIDRGNYIFFEPKYNTPLIPGVYQFSFEYTINNIILSYENFDEFYWNINGNIWNMVIARMGAALSLPAGTEPLGQVALSGYVGNWNENNVEFYSNSNQKNIIGLQSKKPLFIGESVNLILSIPKDMVNITSFNGKLLNFINQYGNILFAFIGFLVIAISYILSWRDFIKNPQKYNYSSKNPYLMHYVIENKIDLKNYGIFLLELFKKNIIDIEKNEQNIFLIKRTDNFASLNKNEKKALSCLFNNHEATLNINDNNQEKLKSSTFFVIKNIKEQIFKFKLKLCYPYLGFGIAMLILSQIAIALLENNFNYYLSFLLIADILFASFIYLFRINFKEKWIRIFAKTFAIFGLGSTIFLLLAIINLSASIFILASVISIMIFIKQTFTTNVLLKFCAAKANELIKMYKEKRETFSIGNEFFRNQTLIFALNCEDLYDNEQSKIPLINKIIEKIE